MRVWTLGQKHPLEKEMTTTFSTLALENPLDSRAWQATVHGVSKSRTWLSDLTTTTPVLSVAHVEASSDDSPSVSTHFSRWASYLEPLWTWSYERVATSFSVGSRFSCSGVASRFSQLPKSNEHSILWMLGPILFVSGRKYLLTSLFQKKK